MASFFRATREARDRDNQVKQALIDNLSECVKAIQFNHQTERTNHQTLGSNDLSNGLCMAVEALFLHGLKDTFFRKAKSAFTGDVDHKPQPAFWPLLLILSHKDNIEQIGSLRNITSEIGQCRAWIRIALNDSLLSSYFYSLIKNMNSSKPYYSQNAFIRDNDLLDVTHRLIAGMESSTWFELPINSSLLNSWPEDVLMLAGIWMPTMKSCPIVSGVDVASTLSTTDRESEGKYIPGRGPNIGIGNMLALNPDEALNLILSNTPENFIQDMNIKKAPNIQPTEEEPPEVPEQDDEPSDAKSSGSKSPEDNDDSEIVIKYDDSIIKHDVNIVGNSIMAKTTWSTHFNQDMKISASNSSSTSPKSQDRKSILSLDLDSNTSEPVTKNLRDVIKGLEEELKLSDNDSIRPEPIAAPLTPDDPMLAGLGFEVLSKSPSTIFDGEELQLMLSRVETLSREYGLDAQDYECKGCQDMLGTTISKAKVCAFTGQYFCSSCMDPNVFIIPARIIHNWDFHRYPVSKRAAQFLLEFQHQSIINIKKVNPLIYTGINEMAQLQLLRIQLNFLRAYLFTCREPVIEDLQRRVWPREYLYEHVHLYSISDLAQISNGSLASQLNKIVTFAQNHVKDCWLCSQKGFICEVCNDPKILYPFDVDTTYRCENCSSVFHSKCLTPFKPCPKCERMKKRQGTTLVDAIHNNFE